MEDEMLKIRQYLLESLPETEADELSIKLIGDKSLEEKMYLAESSLIEDYLEKNLSPAETRLFHENFLVTEERKNQLAEIAALKNFARNIAGKQTSGHHSQSFLHNLSNLLTLNFRYAAALGLLIAVLLGVGIWQFGFLEARTEIAALEKETIALNKQDLSDLSGYENLSGLTLASGILRGADQSKKLSTGTLSEKVLLRLVLPPQETSGAFNVKITRNRTDRIALDKISVYGDQSGKEIRLLLPAIFLKNGEYKIELAPDNRDDFPLTYSFAVQ